MPGKDRKPPQTHTLRIASCPSKNHTFRKLRPFVHVSMTFVYVCECVHANKEGGGICVMDRV